MLDMISNFLTTVDDFVWGIPLIVLILATGLFLTARLRFLQITKLPHAIKHLIANEKSGEDGEVSSFAALCTALSATIGTGNIVGVATAIVAGGPGALFWMWIAALVGTATKYSECLLAVKYRVVAEDGHIIGGPFYYIENGMGKNWKWQQMSQVLSETRAAGVQLRDHRASSGAVHGSVQQKEQTMLTL
jgi:AGCS family alanine or glycine:cation symporter